jgi:hypothetical protein
MEWDVSTSKSSPFTSKQDLTHLVHKKEGIFHGTIPGSTSIPNLVIAMALAEIQDKIERSEVECRIKKSLFMPTNLLCHSRCTTKN